jgi:hypothetical protein
MSKFANKDNIIEREGRKPGNSWKVPLRHLFFEMGFFKIESHELFAWAGLEL